MFQAFKAMKKYFLSGKCGKKYVYSYIYDENFTCSIISTEKIQLVEFIDLVGTKCLVLTQVLIRDKLKKL